MNKPYQIIIIFLMMLLSSQLYGFDRKYIVHKQYQTSVHHYPQSTKLPSKSERTNSSQGRIKIVYNTPVADSIQASIESACKIWTSKIQNKIPICIQIEFDNLGDDLSLITYVGYGEHPSNSCLIPTALMSQIDNYMYGNSDSPDGIIVFNSDVDWNCSFINESDAIGYNVTTQSLRALAICYGFGASVDLTGSDLMDYQQEAPTIFDNKLYNGETCLTSLIPMTKEFNDFVTSENVFFRGKHDHKMYTTNPFTFGKSLIYLNNQLSLMHYDWGNGDCWLNVDDSTLEIVNSIGWDIKSNAILKIESTELGDSGIGSAYVPHKFQIKSNGITFTSPKWTFKLITNAGTEQIICTGNKTDFEIPAISNINNYKCNINGDLDGYVEFSCISDGKELSATPYHVSLELKPMIISIYGLEKIATNGTDNYKLKLNVDYRGADFLTIAMEEEYDDIIRIMRIEEPIIAHITTEELTSLYYNWIDIKVSNKYGSAVKTIEMPAEYSVNNYFNHIDKNNTYDVYDIYGNCIRTNDTRDTILCELPPGLYILEKTSLNGRIVKEKLLIK